MINPFLAARLQPVVRRHRLRRLALGMALWWTLAAVAGWVLFLRGEPPPLTTEFLPDWLMISLLGAGLIWVLWYLMPLGFQGMARRIEKRFPALDGRLLTAVQVDQEEENDQPAFIRERLLSQAMQHSVDHDWNKAVGPLGGTAGQTAALLAVLAFAWVLGCVAMLRWGGKPGEDQMVAVVSVPEESVKLADGVEVTPGDAVLEKGGNLVVLVRFSQAVPENVSLVAGGGATPVRTVPLARSLKDPVFGGGLPGVQEDFRYHIDYDGRSTREFTVKVFEYPRLERSDVVLHFPEWTGLPEKRIEDTRRVSAVEGTRVSVTLKLNKPVASAVLKPRGNGVEPLTLQAEADKPVAVLTNYDLTASGTYELILTDSEGRTGKVPPLFTFEALPNSPPEVKLAQPRGDQTPSALEEMVFNGTARDDFGLLAWGLAFSQGGGEPEYVELGKEAPGGAARDFSHLLRLEEKGVKINDLVSWFVWADDIGPDGKRRRTEGDLFFGEVRPFEQVFRRGQDQDGGGPQGQQGGGQQGGGPGAKLAELQKQIINATWKLKRAPSPKKDDIAVVRDSQKDALTQAEEASAETRDRIMKAGWQKAKALMGQAVQALEESVDKPAGLSGALTAEQAAYQALLKLQEREFQVTRSQSGSPSQSQADQRMQEQLNEMELTEEKNRYEKEREAQAAEESERREDRQVINRLQELAKRQEEVNERLKELQTSLQAAETEEQREALKRELKRLEDEQRELLADVDELNQRMERPENRSRMAEERRQLEQARENARQASEQASQGKADQALSSGTRAQRQLQEMREDMRTKTSSGFEQDLRQMRSQARELASEQQKINERLKSMDDSGGPGLGGDPAREEALKTLAEQKRRSEELTKKAADISESAESAEPLVSRQLYDSMRKYAQDDAAGVRQAQEEMLQSGQISRQMYRRIQEMQNRQEGAKTLDLTSDLLQEDFVDQARSTGQYAQAGIEDFKKGIEKAAENVVGDDTEALRRADSELESLTRELEKEIAEASGGQAGGQPRNDPNSPKASGSGQPGDESGQANRQDGQEEVSSAGAQERPDASGQESGEQAGRSGANGQPEAGTSSQSREGNHPGRQLAQANNREGQQGQGAGQEENSETGDQPPNGGAGRQEGNQAQSRQGGEPGQAQEPGESRQGNQGQGRDEQRQQDGQGDQEGRNRGQDGQRQDQNQQSQSQSQGQGQGQGQGQDERQQPDIRQRPGQERQDQGEQPGQGRQSGQGQGQEGGNEDSQGGESRNPSGNDSTGRGGRSNGTRTAGGGRGGYTRPLGGEGYNEWSDSLRDVQELVEFPDLQNRIADVREAARRMRVEAKRDLKKPDWAVVKSDVLTPLVEVRKSVREELLRRRSGEALVPIDRDPVPGRYSGQVRNYYEKLGKD